MAKRSLVDRFRLRLYDRRIRQTIETGTSPLILRYCQVNASDTKLPTAYRTATVIRSASLGTLTPKEYRYACDTSDVGLRMAQWNVVEAMKHITAMMRAGRHISWVSVRCPSRLVMRLDLYEWMKELIRDNHFQYPEKLCLEFSVSLLGEQTDVARLAVLDMKLLGVKTMLVGCAAGNCPMARLVQIPVDMVMLAPSATRWTGSRNKPDLVPTLISYLHSMRTEVYADGVTRDDQIALLSRYECAGYILSKDYEGKDKGFRRNMSFHTALSQQDTEGEFEV